MAGTSPAMTVRRSVLILHDSFWAGLSGNADVLDAHEFRFKFGLAILERDSEGYYVASAPVIPVCHTQAKSLDALMSRIREAIVLNLEAAGEPVEALEFVGVQRVSVAG
jgi:predicted RNase H-like HicB family nuclease